MEDLGQLESLVAIMDRLRDPGGCPWDREQDYESLRGYLLEECHEVVEALDHGNPAALCEELGDLLFQIVFLSRIAREQQRFTLEDVIRGIAEKMIRRHPHVFGSDTAETAEEVVVKWEEIKKQEKADAAGKPEDKPASLMDGMPAGLPPMLKARRLGERARGVGFDWERTEDIFEKIDEELDELRQAMSRGRDETRLELGDLLFTVVMLARRLHIDPESALEQTNLKFARRFGWIERELERAGTTVEASDMDRLENLWNRAKTELTKP